MKCLNLFYSESDLGMKVCEVMKWRNNSVHLCF